MKLRSVLAYFLITSACAQADTITADDYPSPGVYNSQPLTLVNLTDLALRRNTKTRLSWADIRASEAGLELARAGYWPQIDASISAQRNRALNFTGQSADTQTRYSTSVSLSYLLWDFGTRHGELKQAEFQLVSTRLLQNQVMQDVILQVEQAYYLTLGLEAVVVASRQSSMDAETNLVATLDRRTAGLSTVGDVYRAEAALAEARLALQQTEGQLAAARGALAVAVGDTPDTLLSLAPWEPVTPDALPVQNVKRLLDEAFGTRPDLLAASAQEQASAAKVRAARGSGFPIISLDASTGSTQVQNIGDSSQFSALLSIKIPLFSGFADRASVRQASAELESARAFNEELRSQVALQVWRAYQNLRTSVMTLESSDALLKSAQQAADVSVARYKTGLDTILDALSAQSTLANARVQQIQARFNWMVARATLGHAIGGLMAPLSTQERP